MILTERGGGKEYKLNNLDMDEGSTQSKDKFRQARIKYHKSGILDVIHYTSKGVKQVLVGLLRFHRHSA